MHPRRALPESVSPMAYMPIMGTLAYVLDTDQKSVLMIHRNRRADDQHLGKWNGLGGKLDSGENIAHGVRREIEEEAGLRVTQMHLRGTLSWPGFGTNGEDWFSPIFLVTSFEANLDEPVTTNAEGDLHWIPLVRLLAACSHDDAVRQSSGLDLWEGDRAFIPLVFDDDPRIFHGVMPYAQGRPVSWHVERW